MAGVITQDVIDAIQRSTCNITRRSEIYEADATTLWLPAINTPRLVSGDVTVDSTRTERRAFDGVFDNSDGVLNHDPDGFWYDKVIKVYRGISYNNLRTVPKILIIDQLSGSGNPIVQILLFLGFTDITVNTAASTMDDLFSYDIIVSLVTGTHSTARAALFQKAYSAGMTIWTQATTDTAAQIPLISTTTTKLTPASSTPTFGTYDSALNDGTAPGQTLYADTSTTELITAIRSTAKKGIDNIYSATTYIGAVYEQNMQGGRWVHWQFIGASYSTYIASAPARKFLTNTINWLFNYQASKTWETQIGEFMIDTIDEDSHSALISVTGRDNSKKLEGTKFIDALSFTDGISVDTVIQALAADGGVTKFIPGAAGINITNSPTSAPITFTRTDDRWKAITDIANTNGVEVFFNASGYLVTRPYRDPFTSPVTVTLQTGPTVGNLVTYKKTSNDGQVYNIVVITGESADAVTYQFQYIATNDEPSSPTRVSKLGPRYYFETSSFYTAQNQLVTRGDNLLKVVALEKFDLNFESVVFPWLEAGDIVEFIDPKAGSADPNRFLITALTFPLALGKMSGTGGRLSIVGGS